MVEQEESIETRRGSQLRRLHRLSGAVALTAFLIEHLASNAAALGGQASFDRVVVALTRSRLVALLEVLFVALPLSFHAGYGLVLLRGKSTPDAEIDRYGDRRLWVVQRL